MMMSMPTKIFLICGVILLFSIIATAIETEWPKDNEKKHWLWPSRETAIYSTGILCGGLLHALIQSL